MHDVASQRGTSSVASYRAPTSVMRDSRSGQEGQEAQAAHLAHGMLPDVPQFQRRERLLEEVHSTNTDACHLLLLSCVFADDHKRQVAGLAQQQGALASAGDARLYKTCPCICACTMTSSDPLQYKRGPMRRPSSAAQRRGRSALLAHCEQSAMHQAHDMIFANDGYAPLAIAVRVKQAQRPETRGAAKQRTSHISKSNSSWQLFSSCMASSSHVHPVTADRSRVRGDTESPAAKSASARWAATHLCSCTLEAVC
jgi:hypothetical protein